MQSWLQAQGLISYQLNKATDWETLQSWLSKQTSTETLAFLGWSALVMSSPSDLLDHSKNYGILVQRSRREILSSCNIASILIF